MASAWPELLGIARLKSLDHEALLHQLIKDQDRSGKCAPWPIDALPASLPPRPGGLCLRQAQWTKRWCVSSTNSSSSTPAHNMVFVGGPGTSKTHPGHQPGHSPSVRMASGCTSSPVELVNMLGPRRWARPGNWRIGSCTSISSSSTDGLPRSGWWRLAVPPAVQAVQAHQRGRHHQPGSWVKIPFIRVSPCCPFPPTSQAVDSIPSAIHPFHSIPFLPFLPSIPIHSIPDPIHSANKRIRRKDYHQRHDAGRQEHSLSPQQHGKNKTASGLGRLAPTGVKTGGSMGTTVLGGTMK